MRSQICYIHSWNSLISRFRLFVAFFKILRLLSSRAPLFMGGHERRMNMIVRVVVGWIERIDDTATYIFQSRMYVCASTTKGWWLSLELFSSREEDILLATVLFIMFFWKRKQPRNTTKKMMARPSRPTARGREILGTSILQINNLVDVTCVRSEFAGAEE